MSSRVVRGVLLVMVVQFGCVTSVAAPQDDPLQGLAKAADIAQSRTQPEAERVRAMALMAGLTYDRSLIAPIMVRLLDESPAVRNAALEWLGRFQCDAQVPRLLKMRAEHDANGDVSVAICRIMGPETPKDVRAAMLEKARTLKGGPQRRIIRALSHIRDVGTVEILLGLAAEDKSVQVACLESVVVLSYDFKLDPGADKRKLRELSSTSRAWARDPDRDEHTRALAAFAWAALLVDVEPLDAREMLDLAVDTGKRGKPVLALWQGMLAHRMDPSNGDVTKFMNGTLAQDLKRCKLSLASLTKPTKDEEWVRIPAKVPCSMAHTDSEDLTSALRVRTVSEAHAKIRMALSESGYLTKGGVRMNPYSFPLRDGFALSTPFEEVTAKGEAMAPPRWGESEGVNALSGIELVLRFLEWLFITSKTYFRFFLFSFSETAAGQGTTLWDMSDLLAWRKNSAPTPADHLLSRELGKGERQMRLHLLLFCFSKTSDSLKVNVENLGNVKDASKEAGFRKKLLGED